eukprot:COSAG02_NODE_8316_length_2619_cov_20.653968_4_plen_252_part_00
MGSLQHPPEPMLVVLPTRLLACVGAWVLPKETLVGVAGGVATPIGGLILSPSTLGGSMDCCSRVKLQRSLCGLVVYWRCRCSCSRRCRWGHLLFCLTTLEGILLREALETLPDKSSLLTGSCKVHRRSSVRLLRVQRPWMRLLWVLGCRWFGHTRHPLAHCICNRFGAPASHLPRTARRRSRGPVRGSCVSTTVYTYYCMIGTSYISTFNMNMFPTEPCVLRTFGHDGKLNTCAQSVPKKFRDRLRADKNQ